MEYIYHKCGSQKDVDKAVDSINKGSIELNEIKLNFAKLTFYQRVYILK